MKILVLNSGSSSIKYRLFDMSAENVLATGLIERIGEPVGHASHRYRDPAGMWHEGSQDRYFRDHRSGIECLFSSLGQSGLIASTAELSGIGHRVVHGGEAFREPVLIDEAVIQAIRRQVPLAPLHNPANLMGIEVARAQCPQTPQVAVFDTAFHQTLPPEAYHYALPYEFYTGHGVRRYGFHGTSHAYVSKAAAEFIGRPPAALNLITLHLGNGASAAAISAGKSVDTSMGMTPLEGLVMGTRCGDLDPSIIFYLEKALDLDSSRIEYILNHESGLRGLCQLNDMRQIHEAAQTGEPRALLAIELFCYRIRKYVGAYFAVLGRVDALVFSAGIGEHDASIRARICAGLEGLGIHIDPARNTTAGSGVREIQASGNPLQVLVIPTDEELEIARQTRALTAGSRFT